MVTSVVQCNVRLTWADDVGEVVAEVVGGAAADVHGAARAEALRAAAEDDAAARVALGAAEAHSLHTHDVM